MKYEHRLFYMDNDAICAWHLMFSSDGFVCCRRLSGIGCDWELRSKYEKEVPVPRPKLSKEENAKLREIFKMFGINKEKREALTKEFIWERWKKSGEKMIEELAKADWEKYVESKKRNKRK